MTSLINRKRYSTTIDNELLQKFIELTKETRISQSKLIDEALEDLLKKYNKTIAPNQCYIR